jgi:hypothetical protein
MNSVADGINAQPLDDVCLDAVSGGDWREKVVEHVVVHFVLGAVSDAVSAGAKVVKDGLNAVATAAESVARAQGSPRQ